MSRALSFDIEDLPMDVFELADSGLEVDSLTGGHGMLDNAASIVTSKICSGPDCCCCVCGGGGCGTCGTGCNFVN